MAAYKLPQQLMILDRVFAFSPDVLVLAAHEIDPREAVGHLMDRGKLGIRAPFDTLQRLTEEAGVGKAPDPVARRWLDRHQDDITRWAYQQIVRRCAERGVRPVLLFVPTPDGYTSRDPSRTARLAHEAGLATLDLSGAYAGHDLRTLQLTSFDYHPNALGHQLLGSLFYRRLADSVLPFGPAQTAGSTVEAR